ncbi:hypothetical protein LguiA_014650 [Lonicera macranthoides]
MNSDENTIELKRKDNEEPKGDIQENGDEGEDVYCIKEIDFCQYIEEIDFGQFEAKPLNPDCLELEPCNCGEASVDGGDNQSLEDMMCLDAICWFRWDRQWLIVNSKGRAYTQRVEPKLALIEVKLPNEAFSEAWEPSNNSFLEVDLDVVIKKKFLYENLCYINGIVVISALGMEELKVSLSKPREILDDVSVWEWCGSALYEGDEASKWFSDFLSKPSRLVCFNHESETRPVNPDYAPGYKVMFSDAYPFLLLSQGSMDELNKHLEEPISVNSFRPKYCTSFLLMGVDHFLRTYGRILESTGLNSKVLSYATAVPTINQENAIPGREPNETLKKFRSDAVLPLNQKQGRVRP